jgi:hypothetical protein
LSGFLACHRERAHRRGSGRCHNGDRRAERRDRYIAPPRGGNGGTVMRLAGRQDDADRQALTVCAKVDFGRKATTRAAKILVLRPPFAPAAQWCARMMVLSIICKASAPPPPSASACNSTSQIPLSVQRRNCRHTEFQLPSSLGRSRQGAPVRAIQKIASNTRR